MLFTTASSTVPTVFGMITAQLASFKSIAILAIGLPVTFWVIELMIYIMRAAYGRATDPTLHPTGNRKVDRLILRERALQTDFEKLMSGEDHIGTGD